MLVIGSLVKDHHHSWYDCLAGGIIGATIGYAHFRANYYGVWDYRVNHIPLPREGFPLSEDDIAYRSCIYAADVIGYAGGF